jgi:hypothetical protein
MLDVFSRRERRWLRCRNAAPSTLEAYSVLQIVDSTIVRGRAVLEVEPCDAEGVLTRAVAALGATRLPAGKFGRCTMQWPAVVRVDGPVMGFEPVLGPTDASPGVISAEGRGFMTLGDSLPDPWRVPASYGWQHFNPRMIRFRLPEAGLKRTQQMLADAETLNFWDGYGAKPLSAAVWNLPISDDYLFGGTHLRNGLAVYDDRLDRYRIVNMESG